MSIQALSCGGCSTYAPPRSEGVCRHHERRDDVRGDDDASRAQHAPRRQGGFAALFDALSAELKALAAADEGKAATATTTAVAKPAAGAANEPSLRAALKDFTEALFDSLRDAIGSDGGRGHGWGRGGMHGLSERIEALARKLGTSAAPAATRATAPVAADEKNAEAVSAPGDKILTTVPAAAVSELEAGFATLWKALNPDRLEERGGLSDLLAFLRRLAERLDRDRAGRGSIGNLVDTSA